MDVNEENHFLMIVWKIRKTKASQAKPTGTPKAGTSSFYI